MHEEMIDKKVLIKRCPPNQADMLTNWPDVSKARDLLDWAPLMDLIQGVNKLWNGTKQNAAGRGWFDK